MTTTAIQRNKKVKRPKLENHTINPKNRRNGEHRGSKAAKKGPKTSPIVLKMGARLKITTLLFLHLLRETTQKVVIKEDAFTPQHLKTIPISSNISKLSIETLIRTEYLNLTKFQAKARIVSKTKKMGSAPSKTLQTAWRNLSWEFQSDYSELLMPDGGLVDFVEPGFEVLKVYNNATQQCIFVSSEPFTELNPGVYQNHSREFFRFSLSMQDCIGLHFVGHRVMAYKPVTKSTLDCIIACYLTTDSVLEILRLQGPISTQIRVEGFSPRNPSFQTAGIAYRYPLNPSEMRNKVFFYNMVAQQNERFYPTNMVILTLNEQNIYGKNTFNLVDDDVYKPVKINCFLSRRSQSVQNTSCTPQVFCLVLAKRLADQKRVVIFEKLDLTKKRQNQDFTILSIEEDSELVDIAMEVVSNHVSIIDNDMLNSIAFIYPNSTKIFFMRRSLLGFKSPIVSLKQLKTYSAEYKFKYESLEMANTGYIESYTLLYVSASSVGEKAPPVLGMRFMVRDKLSGGVSDVVKQFVGSVDIPRDRPWVLFSRQYTPIFVKNLNGSTFIETTVYEKPSLSLMGVSIPYIPTKNRSQNFSEIEQIEQNLDVLSSFGPLIDMEPGPKSPQRGRKQLEIRDFLKNWKNQKNAKNGKFEQNWPAGQTLSFEFVITDADNSANFSIPMTPMPKYQNFNFGAYRESALPFYLENRPWTTSYLYKPLICTGDYVGSIRHNQSENFEITIQPIIYDFNKVFFNDLNLLKPLEAEFFDQRENFEKFSFLEKSDFSAPQKEERESGVFIGPPVNVITSKYGSRTSQLTFRDFVQLKILVENSTLSGIRKHNLVVCFDICIYNMLMEANTSSKTPKTEPFEISQKPPKSGLQPILRRFPYSESIDLSYREMDQRFEFVSGVETTAFGYNFQNLIFYQNQVSLIHRALYVAQDLCYVSIKPKNGLKIGNYQVEISAENRAGNELNTTINVTVGAKMSKVTAKIVKKYQISSPSENFGFDFFEVFNTTGHWIDSYSGPEPPSNLSNGLKTDSGSNYTINFDKIVYTYNSSIQANYVSRPKYPTVYNNNTAILSRIIAQNNTKTPKIPQIYKNVSKLTWLVFNTDYLITGLSLCGDYCILGSVDPISKYRPNFGQTNLSYPRHVFRSQGPSERLDVFPNAQNSPNRSISRISYFESFNPFLHFDTTLVSETKGDLFFVMDKIGRLTLNFIAELDLLNFVKMVNEVVSEGVLSFDYISSHFHGENYAHLVVFCDGGPNLGLAGFYFFKNSVSDFRRIPVDSSNLEDLLRYQGVREIRFLSIHHNTNNDTFEIILDCEGDQMLLITGTLIFEGNVPDYSTENRRNGQKSKISKNDFRAILSQKTDNLSNLRQENRPKLKFGSLKAQKYHKPVYFRNIACKTTKDFIACAAPESYLEWLDPTQKHSILTTNLFVWAKIGRKFDGNGYTYRIENLGLIDPEGSFAIQDYSKNQIIVVSESKKPIIYELCKKAFVQFSKQFSDFEDSDVTLRSNRWSLGREIVFKAKDIGSLSRYERFFLYFMFGILVLFVAIGGCVAWYFFVYRRRKEQRDQNRPSKGRESGYMAGDFLTKSGTADDDTLVFDIIAGQGGEEIEEEKYEVGEDESRESTMKLRFHESSIITEFQ